MTTPSTPTILPPGFQAAVTGSLSSRQSQASATTGSAASVPLYEAVAVLLGMDVRSLWATVSHNVEINRAEVLHCLAQWSRTAPTQSGPDSDSMENKTTTTKKKSSIPDDATLREYIRDAAEGVHWAEELELVVLAYVCVAPIVIFYKSATAAAAAAATGDASSVHEFKARASTLSHALLNGNNATADPLFLLLDSDQPGGRFVPLQHERHADLSFSLHAVAQAALLDTAHDNNGLLTLSSFIPSPQPCFFRILDIRGMDDETKKHVIQAPMYQLYKQIYRGPRYDTSAFCDKKFVDELADCFVVGMAFIFVAPPAGQARSTRRLVGGAYMKVRPLVHANQQLGIVEMTSGYLSEFRGKNVTTVFSMTTLRTYQREHPERSLYFFDLLTSSITYNMCIKNYPTCYPRYDRATPAEIESLMLRLIDDMPQYDLIPGNTDPLVMRGAQVKEPPAQLFARLTRGAFEPPHTRYYYEKTKSINSSGLLTLTHINPGLPDQILDGSAAQDRKVFAQLLEQQKISASAPATAATTAAATPAAAGPPPSRFVTPTAEFTDFAYLIELRNKLLPKLTGSTLSSMMPERVTIELSADDENYCRDILGHMGYVGPIKFCGSLPGVSYRQRADVFSSKTMQVVFKHDGHPVFATVVPQGGFNPYTGPIGAKFVEMILHGDIPVTDKYVLDLGCGSGNVGLAAILMGARNVIFSDIDAMYLPEIQNNPLVIVGDHDFQAQSLVSETLKKADKLEKYDVLMMSTPTFNMEETDSADANCTSALFQSKQFLRDLIDQAGQILKYSGDLVIWFMFANFQPATITTFLNFFKGHFDVHEVAILAIEPQAKIPIFSKDEILPGNYYVMYRIRKTEACHDTNGFEAKVSGALLKIAAALRLSAAKYSEQDDAGMRELAVEFEAASVSSQH
ncbi:hypothetical protein CAOG_08085 [Capsaspora owczarzaki ATCC 30864]|uniref:Methyltransferase small domain-containing protein n=1 Tax=Capsaspora owczarzaki (strain ATCC 30864) TaxID=595528 RepID=A0A0D2WYJ8_CAPO3|nr:hypothetical protein CAOG_08085 [Capsaspora owczarzaki ATCC 30864]KJE98048.1 hypothetical protein CAOG_008085 [Capsaspora owczarzaki ATCC 30864]|eukprot:XP_004342686.1 hypothetical protein CAOG_08085 [Capsaspora owczarzaki ATCC 30864]